MKKIIMILTILLLVSGCGFWTYEDYYEDCRDNNHLQKEYCICRARCQVESGNSKYTCSDECKDEYDHSVI